MLDSTIISLLKEMKENCLKAGFYKDPKRNDKAEALNYAIFIIESMGSRNGQAAGMWIKCSDRLPTEGEFVLCVVDDGKIWVACMVDNYDGGYEFCEPLDFCNIGPVTHWMPLPGLPKEE